MDGSLAEASTRGHFVNQQCLSVSDRDSSQSVSQQGVLCGDANMLENQVRDNKPLNTFDAQPYEARSMLLPYRQEMSVLTGASEESTASDRCPSSPSLVECTDQPSGASTFIKNKKTGESLVNNGSDDTGVPLRNHVKLTCKNAIIECLQYKENISTDEIFSILSERFMGTKGQPMFVRRTISNVLSFHTETFVRERKTEISDGRKDGVWHLKEYNVDAMKDSVVVDYIDNNPIFSKDPEVPDCKNKIFTKIHEVSGYKNEIIECLLNGGEMSVDEISEYITMRRQSRKNNRQVIKSGIRDVLALHDVIFKRVSRSGNMFDKKNVRWFMEEDVKEKFRSSVWLCSIVPINSIATPPVFPKGPGVPVCKKKYLIKKSKLNVYSCKNEIIECLRNGGYMTLTKICENINRKRQSRNLNKKVRKSSVSHMLSLGRGIFKRIELYENSKCGVWSLEESVKNKSLSLEGLVPIDTPPLVSDVEKDTYAAMVCRCFDGRKVLTLLEVYAAVLKQHPDINEYRPRWRIGVRKVLKEIKYFQWMQSYEGVSNKKGFWCMVKSMKESVKSDEPLKSSNVAPPFPIIQPCLSPIASGEGGGVSAMASQMDQSEGMGSIFSQENFLLLQEFLEGEVRKTRTIKKNNVERISEDELIECVNAGEKLTHNKYDENREEQNLYINKNENGYFYETLKSESKKLVAPPFRNPSVENDNDFGGEARPVQFGCMLGSPLIDKGYNDVNMEQEDL